LDQIVFYKKKLFLDTSYWCKKFSIKQKNLILNRMQLKIQQWKKKELKKQAMPSYRHIDHLKAPGVNKDLNKCCKK